MLLLTTYKKSKIHPQQKNGGVVPYMADKRVAVVAIGCGECKECRKAKQREWQVRLKEDIKHNTNGKLGNVRTQKQLGRWRRTRLGK